jgi:hypothetical protein
MVLVCLSDPGEVEASPDQGVGDVVAVAFCQMIGGGEHINGA